MIWFYCSTCGEICCDLHDVLFALPAVRPLLSVSNILFIFVPPLWRRSGFLGSQFSVLIEAGFLCFEQLALKHLAAFLMSDTLTVSDMYNELQMQMMRKPLLFILLVYNQLVLVFPPPSAFASKLSVGVHTHTQLPALSHPSSSLLCRLNLNTRE